MSEEELEAGRLAFARRDWATAHAALSGADLTAGDLELLSVASFLLARDEEGTRALEAAHRAWVVARESDHAARSAAWLALLHLLRGEDAVGTGWLARAERIVSDAPGPCAARGLVLVPAVLEALGRGDARAAMSAAEEMLAIGQEFADVDVTAFGLLTCGEAAVAAGDLEPGLRLFDEVMVAVSADDLSPITAGIVYCAVIEGCMRAFDLRRAAAWTEALRRWCDGQPDLVPYRGQCLVHRSQVLQAQGAWDEATSEVERACEALSDPAHPALALAWYQKGELHRVRGELDDSGRAYREAGRHGFDPLPGFALLRLAEGRLDAALALVERMLEQRGPVVGRPPALSAAVEVLLAAGDSGRARIVCDELVALTEQLAAPALRPVAAYASGVVHLVEGAPGNALEALRDARDQARRLGLPHEEARARLQAATACRALGDEDSAEMELDAAIVLLERLGAGPDLGRAHAMRAAHAGPTTVLTRRECEVLRHVAAGMTNREIAGALHISEHTVARHLQNIFTKTGCPSRSAATAYAYQQGLVPAGGQS